MLWPFNSSSTDPLRAKLRRGDTIVTYPGWWVSIECDKDAAGESASPPGLQGESEASGSLPALGSLYFTQTFRSPAPASYIRSNLSLDGAGVIRCSADEAAEATFARRDILGIRNRRP